MHSRAEARTHHQTLGAGWRARMSRPIFFSSLGLRLPACWLEERWEALTPTIDVMLRLPASTAGFFFLRDDAILSSLRSAGES
jgi:hypothetical protein